MSDAACGQEFRAFDGPQKCGRVKGHPGAHTRDPLPSDRRAFDAASTRNLGMCMAADCKRDATNVFHPGRATVLVRFCDEHMESYRKGLSRG